MSKNILYSSNARDSIKLGVEKVVGAIEITLGPKGRNVVLERAYGVPLITNDGVTIAKEIELDDPFENLGASIIKEVSTKTNDVAGDGTTTAGVLAKAIINEGFKKLEQGENPIFLKRGIQLATDTICKKLVKNSNKIEKSREISQIATISSGDVEVGELIANAYESVGKDGVITCEESSSMKTSLKIVQGLQIDRGYVSSYMLTDQERSVAEFENAYILVASKKLIALSDVLPIMEQVASAGGKLLVVADDIDGEALSALVLNKLRGALDSVAVRAPSFGDKRKQILQDIATATGATLISDDYGVGIKSVTLDMLGSAKKVKVSKDCCIITEGSGSSAEIESRVNTLKKQIEIEISEYEKSELKKRLASLCGGVAQIFVGAPTELEMKEKKLRIEDALSATRAAILEGVVPGGGVALFRCKEILKNKIKSFPENMRAGAECVFSALSSPLEQIAKNAGDDCNYIKQMLSTKNWGFVYDAEKSVFGNMFALGVIDPTKVTRSALQNASSVALTLLTTECAIVENKKN